MGVVGGEEAVLNVAACAVFNVLLLHDGTDETLGTGLASEVTILIIGSGRTLDEDVFHGPKTLTTLRAVELMSATRL